ncbi:MAG: hypothetical protein V4751_14515 [Pseudomonadota bacterium]
MNTSRNTAPNTRSGPTRLHSFFNQRFLGRTLLTALLLLIGSQAFAEHNDWRLGERNRIYQRIDGDWRRVPGSAIDVGDGWVIGTDSRSGGYGIYRWNGYRFDRAPGGAVEIGGTYEHPWVINNRGERFEWNGRDWYEVQSAGSHRGERHNDHDDSYRRRPGW